MGFTVKNDMLPATKAVAFAEDAYFDTAVDFAACRSGDEQYLEVHAALQQVRRIAASGIRAVEAP